MRVPHSIDKYIEYQAWRLSSQLIREATYQRSLEMAREARLRLPDIPVDTLDQSHWQKAQTALTGRWGAIRLRHFAGWCRGWMTWALEQGHAHPHQQVAIEPPRWRPQPKSIYSPGEIHTMWTRGNRFVRSILGLGLFAGFTPSDCETIQPTDLDGQWLVMARTKTGVSRRCWLPSWVVAELELPLTGGRKPVSRRRVSCLWRDTSRRYLGHARPYTALRTTLRTVAGGVDPEVLEMCVMGHTPGSTAVITGANRVGLEHYVRVDAIDPARIRRVGQKVIVWLYGGIKID